MVKLVDEADLVAADRRAPIVVEATTGDAVDQHFAAIRALQQAGDMQERRLAGSRRRDQRNRLATSQGKIRTLEDGQERFAFPVVSLDAGKLQCHARIHSVDVLVIRNAGPAPDRGAKHARPGRLWRGRKG